MKNRHIYIFNGPAKSGKSDLASLINKTDSIVIVDDFIIPDDRNHIIEELDNQINNQIPLRKINDRSLQKKFEGTKRHLVIYTIIIITNSDEVDISRLIQKLDDSEEYSRYVISYLDFKRGDLFL